MKHTPTRRIAIAVTSVVALALPLAACSDGASEDGPVEISFLTWNEPGSVSSAEALIEAFEAAHPDIKVRLETQPGDAEGHNLTKTKLATGEMEDVFNYNSGSLLQALNPDQNLVPLTDEPWVDELVDSMKAVVSTENALYGMPWATAQAGAVLYNKRVYADLGLSIPTTWDEFAANNEKIKSAGLTPVIQTYGTDWTAQLFVLADYGNVAAQEPDWHEKYTIGQRKYVDQPALQGFLNQQIGFESGWWNENFASATLEEGIRMLAQGEGAHYPMVTGLTATIQQNHPDELEDVGVFAMPAQKAEHTTLTVWLPNALYIAKTAEGPKLEAAKKFVAFASSPEGCKVQTTILVPSGPFATSACQLPNDVPTVLKDMQPYFDAERTMPALEFLSPVKGPNLPGITVEVGSGIRSAVEGAAFYDEDVVKQAQQLGLDGW